MPQPQTVRLGAADFPFTRDWNVLPEGIAPGDAALEVLNQELATRFHWQLTKAARPTGTLRLVIAPNSARVGEAQDRDRDVLAEQAYKIELSRDRVTIVANAPAGLYYGVVTFVQLLKPLDGALMFPEGEIEDWPDLQMRQLY
jgi:N-acetyl-beta-hexosaminidase